MSLFLSAPTCRQSFDSYVQTLPNAFCLCDSLAPERCTEQFNLSVVTYSAVVINRPCKNTRCYFTEHTLISIITGVWWGEGRGIVVYIG